MKLSGDQVILQQDLARKLAQTDDILDSLDMILQAAIKAFSMECRGICLKNDRTGGFDLFHSVRLSEDFPEKYGMFSLDRSPGLE